MMTDLAALPSTIVIPGIASWLGRTPEQEQADYRASLDGHFTESFEDFCARISRTEATDA